MKAPCIQVFVHFVWASWDRLPLITPEIERAVFACIHKECEEMKVEMVVWEERNVTAAQPHRLLVRESAKALA